jgi:hypothetical protein
MHRHRRQTWLIAYGLAGRYLGVLEFGIDGEGLVTHGVDEIDEIEDEIVYR